MTTLRNPGPCLLALAAVAFALSGCTANHVSPPVMVHATLHGVAMGGEQPITDAGIHLYEVGTTGDGSVATDLLGSNVVTTSDGTSSMDANANAGNENNSLAPGSFTITGDYTCPTMDTLVYLAAVGGNPGAGTNNAQEQIVALGDCGNLASTTFITVNEVTTVGTTVALHDYMTAYNAVGSSNANAAALATAFNTAAEYMNPTYGTAPGPALPPGYDASSNDVRALANVVQNCVNSNGSTANGTNCGIFFADAQGTAAAPPTDTVTALLDIFADPTHDVSAIFNLQGITPAFAPTFTSAPVDWSLPIRAIPPAPVFSPAAGAVPSGTAVTISDTDGTATIYYTTDGSTPTTSSTVYSSAVTVSLAETVNAIAVDANGRVTSVAGSASYTVTQLVPTVSLSAVSSESGSTTPMDVTAMSNANGSVVTFGVTSPADGSFSPATCTIANGACSVSYLPSGLLATGTYAGDLTASFTAASGYASSSATSTLNIGTAPAFGFSVLHSFTGNPDGSSPYYGTLIQASDGNFYGTTQSGGTGGVGTLFKMTPTGVETAIYPFSLSGYRDGKYPDGSLVEGTDGNLYGTAESGAASQLGSVFQATSGGGFNLLYSFSGSVGQNPYAGLVQGTDGYFYGTTSGGGANSNGGIFKISSSGSFSLLYSFSSAGTADGKDPQAGLVQGADGNFYGTAFTGGAQNYGTVFQVTSTGAFTLLHSFSATDGAHPNAGLVQGADGNFYGTTEEGANGYGNVFKISSGGAFTVLHSFSSASTDGEEPFSSLTEGSDGNFYGTTLYGGANGYGVVYRMTPAGVVTVLHSFATGSADGEYPYSGVVQGADGKFYGTTNQGGSGSDGIAFQLTPSPALAAPVALNMPASAGAGATFTLGYAVANANSATLKQCFATNTAGDSTGWVGLKTASVDATNVTLTAPKTAGTYSYTLTCGGMESGFGTLQVVEGAPKFSLASGDYTDAQSVTITDTDSNATIYYTTNGTTPTTGSTKYTGPVTVNTPTATLKAIAVDGSSTSSVSSVTYNLTEAAPEFSPAPGQYNGPVSVTISNADASAVFYYTLNGTTPTTSSALYTGPILVNASETLSAIAMDGSLTSQSTSAAYTIEPIAPTVSLSAVSSSYGSTVPVTITASSPGNGSLVTFGLTGTATGSFSPATCMISSGSCSVSYVPTGTLAMGMYTADLTASFSTAPGYLAVSTNSTLTITAAPVYNFSLVYSFGGSDGSSPVTGLIQGADGNFYGTTQFGGVNGLGTVFKVTPGGTLTTLHNFAGGSGDGEYPYGGLVQGTDGNFYGTTNQGGSHSEGTVFKMTPTGTVTLLHSFYAGGYTDGGYPQAALVQGTDGNFYGTTYEGGADAEGTVFQITPTGTITLLHSFENADGFNPEAALVQGSDGSFYGTTFVGGANHDGVVFKITAGGTFTLLHSFAGAADGESPEASLAQGSDGNFYGTTLEGGANNDGVVFTISASGTFTLLHSFAGTVDGERPVTGLVPGSDGNLYGTTQTGGANDAGTVFEIAPSGGFVLVFSFSSGATDGGNPEGNLLQGSDGNFYGTALDGGANYDGAVFKITPPSPLAGPVTLTVPASVTHGTSFTLSYAAGNAYSATLEQCYATNNGGDTTGWTGVKTAATTATNVSLTAPATVGSYVYTLTCGGMETGLATVTVQ
jgi:uncharacterized repeat protein (TIGR03803 family)